MALCINVMGARIEARYMAALRLIERQADYTRSLFYLNKNVLVENVRDNFTNKMVIDKKHNLTNYRHKLLQKPKKRRKRNEPRACRWGSGPSQVYRLLMPFIWTEHPLRHLQGVSLTILVLCMLLTITIVLRLLGCLLHV